jgi:glycosyltransferase 2 family protein
MKRTHWAKGLLGLMSAVVLVWCLRQIWVTFQWAQIFQVMNRANGLWFWGAGTLANGLFGLLRSWRWFMLLRNLRLVVPFWMLHLCNVGVMCVTILTPLQSGEVLKVELLKKHCQLERFSGYSSFLVERIVDLAVVLAIASISGLNLWLAQAWNISPVTLIYLGVVALFVGSVALFSLRRVMWPTHLGAFMERLLASLWACTRNGRSLFGVVLISAAAWVMTALAWQVCLKSIAIDLNLFQALSLMSLTTMINLLSFIPGAVGISEVSVTTLLSYFGFEPSLAQAGAVLIRFQAFLLILVSLAHWLVLQVVGRSRPEVS